MNHDVLAGPTAAGWQAPSGRPSKRPPHLPVPIHTPTTTPQAGPLQAAPPAAPVGGPARGAPPSARLSRDYGGRPGGGQAGRHHRPGPAVRPPGGLCLSSAAAVCSGTACVCGAAGCRAWHEPACTPLNRCQYPMAEPNPNQPPCRSILQLPPIHVVLCTILVLLCATAGTLILLPPPGPQPPHPSVVDQPCPSPRRHASIFVRGADAGLYITPSWLCVNLAGTILAKALQHAQSQNLCCQPSCTPGGGHS